ncbi:MAG: hypothetical protein ABIE70_03950 [bacterium]
MSRSFFTIMAAVVVCTFGSVSASISCGDFNGNGNQDVADLVFLVNYMFNGGPPPPYPPTCDCNGSGVIDIADLVCWVQWMFNGGWPPSCPFVVIGDHNESSGGCLDSVAARDAAPSYALGDPPKGQLQVEVIGNDIVVRHVGANYQCCLEYGVEWVQSGVILTGFEYDSGELCDCYCDFDLTSVVESMPPSEYTVVLIGIEGDTVGVATATIPAGQPTVIDYGDSGCLLRMSTEVRASVEYTYAGDTLSMVHYDGYFNCGGVIATECELVGDTIRFFEFNVSDEWQYCMCYFEVYAVVTGIVPGTYIAEVYTRDYPDEPIVLADRRQIVLGD